MATAQKRFGFASQTRWLENLRSALAGWAQARELSAEQMAEQLIREPPLLLSLIGDVTIGESYFFRLQGHFAPLVAAARRVLAHADARFCVWSAGCAAGEEPYSIALALRDALPSSDLARVMIVGTDVDRAALATAEAAVYGAWAFRGVDPAQIDRGFRRLPDGRYQLLPELRQLVTFRHYPLREHLSLLGADSLDAIFFRNVSVYLTEEANQSIYEGFARVLRPGGVLFIAPTDFRPKVATLRAAKSPDCTVFERFHADSASPSEVRSEPSAPNPFTKLGSNQTAPMPKANASTSAPNSAGARPASQRTSSSDPWQQIDQLTDAGELAKALEVLTKLANALGHTPEFHQRRGRVHLARGDGAAAVADFRRVLYLTPDDCSTRYWYALALRNVGQCEAARHQLELIARDRSNVDKRLLSSAISLLRVLPADKGRAGAPHRIEGQLLDPPSGVFSQSESEPNPSGAHRRSQSPKAFTATEERIKER